MIILELVLVIFIRIVIRVCLIFVNDMCESKLSKIEVGWK